MTDDDWPAVRDRLTARLARPLSAAGAERPSGQAPVLSYPTGTLMTVTRFSPPPRPGSTAPSTRRRRRRSARGTRSRAASTPWSSPRPARGKTLAAFLSALDRLAAPPLPDDPLRRCRVLYVSPLKALAVDVERNLRSPLAGIGQAAARLGLPRSGRHGGDAVRRHAGRRAARLRPAPAGHPDHDAGVAVPAAHLGGPRGAARRRHGDRRRGPRGVRHQARRPPGASPSSASTRCSSSRRSASGCRPRCARSTRSRPSSPAAVR